LRCFVEAAKYDINPDKVMQNFIYYTEVLVEQKLVPKTFIEKIRSQA